MAEAMIFDAIRTPRGRGKSSGALYDIKPVNLLAGALNALAHRHDLDTSQVDDVVIGCGAVVIRDVPVGETWAGNPAKPVTRLAPIETLTELEEQGWEEVATRDEQAAQAWEEWWTHSRS